MLRGEEPPAAALLSDRLPPLQTSLALVSFGRLSALYLYTTAAGTVVSENLSEDLDLLLLPFRSRETFLESCRTPEPEPQTDSVVGFIH